MSPRPRDEAGSVIPLVVAMIGVLVLLGAALGTVAAMVQAHRRAQSGADLASLAGARGLSSGRDPCTDAGRVAIANGVHLDECRVVGRDVWVSVRAAGPQWLGQEADLSAQARAGPR